MDASQAQALRTLLEGQDLLALGTLRGGEPFVSMCPYALLPAGQGLVVHVSRLATHTRDMLEHPGVSVLVTDRRSPEVPPQAVARATLEASAEPCAEGDPRYAAARAAYLARFPDTEFMFGFADFTLFVIVPRALRFVGGFAQAWSITGETYAGLMADTP